MDLLKSFYEKEFIRTGNFTIQDGQKTSLYFDFRSLEDNETLNEEVISLLSKKLTDNFIKDWYAYSYAENPIQFKKYLCGAPKSGALLTPQLIKKFQPDGHVGVISVQKRKNGSYIAKIPQLDPNEPKVPKVIVIEDVLTTGISVYKTILALEKAGCEVIGVVTIFDRHQTSKDFTFPRNKYDIHSLYQPNDLIEINSLMTSEKRIEILEELAQIDLKRKTYYNFLAMIETRKTNLIVSMDDFETPKQILDYIQMNGSKIAIVSLHSDILEFSDHDHDNQLTEIEFWSRLKYWKQKYNFLVMEDAKIADTSKITFKKIKKINRYGVVDLVTLQILTIPGILEALPENYQGPQFVIVADMSSKTIIDLLMEDKYSNIEYNYHYPLKDFLNVKKYPVIFGCITNKRYNYHSNGIIYMSSGISVTKREKDDQCYRTPEKAISDGSHTIIVGSGITEYNLLHDDMTEKYRQRGFEAYQNHFLGKSKDK